MLASQQLKTFLIFIVVGIIISFIFDIFRILRKTYKFTNIMIYIQDILFWLLTGIIILHSIFTYNSGELRIYLFFSIFIGIVLYTCSISTHIIDIGTIILKIINKLIIILFKPFKFLQDKLVKQIQKISYTVNKAVKKS